jgi:soluble lytic murein transglycosylase
MEIFRQNYAAAVLAADTLLTTRSFAGTMTSADEVKLLRAMSLEKMNRRNEAVSGYISVTNNVTSYYGGLADERLARLNSPRAPSVAKTELSLPTAYPIRYRNELLRHAKSRGIDPRFVLAIMKQESSFNTNAKSPAAARGLLQLVFDTAVKYNKQAGYPTIREDDLYRPDVNIAIGCVYIAELKKQFGGLYEAVAASYNGGEDNVVRWMNRTNPKEPAIFAAEVGFSETKNYVFKVMGNYRVYRALYNEDLTRKL